jgi:hypothetical protein
MVGIDVANCLRNSHGLPKYGGMASWCVEPGRALGCASISETGRVCHSAAHHTAAPVTLGWLCVDAHNSKGGRKAGRKVGRKVGA